MFVTLVGLRRAAARVLQIHLHHGGVVGLQRAHRDAAEGIDALALLDR